MPLPDPPLPASIWMDWRAVTQYMDDNDHVRSSTCPRQLQAQRSASEAAYVLSNVICLYELLRLDEAVRARRVSVHSGAFHTTVEHVLFCDNVWAVLS